MYMLTTTLDSGKIGIKQRDTSIIVFNIQLSHEGDCQYVIQCNI